MARLVAPCVYLLALNGCSLLMTLHPLVSEENAVAEPRLVGTWEIIDPGMNDDEDTTRFLVTTISPGNDSGRGAAYQVAFATVDGDTVVYVGRLGPFDGDRWVLDLTPGGPVPALTTRYPNLLSAHVPVIVRRDSAELGFAFFNESVDDLVSAVREGGVRRSTCFCHPRTMATIISFSPNAIRTVYLTHSGTMPSVRMLWSRCHSKVIG